MRYLRDLPIRVKLMVVCMMTATFALLVAAMAFYVYELRTMQAELAQRYVMIAETIAPLTAAPLIFGYREEAEDILRHLRQHPDLMGAVVYDEVGAPFAQVTREDIILEGFPPPVEPPKQTFRDSVLLIFQDIYSDGERIGTLHLRLRPTEAQQRASNYTFLTAVILVVSLGAAFLISTRLIRVFSRPVIGLAEITQRVSEEGNYALRAVKTTNDELGALIDSFNGMLDQIQARDEELEEHRERLEEEVARRTEELRKLSVAVEQSPNTIVITDTDMRVDYVNSRFTETTGYAVEEALTQNPALITTGDLEGAPLRRLVETLRTGGEWRGEYRNHKKNGEQFWESATIAPLRTEEGRVTHYVWVKEDITERKRAERALRESEERYALAARGANDGLWDWDLRNGTVHYSARWASMLGLDSEEVGTTPDDWLDRIHPDDREAVREAMEEHWRGETPHFEHEYRMRHKDGRWRWVLSRGEAVRDEEGVAYRFAGSQTDITDRKLAETKLYYEASHDALTGLPNRGLFTDRLTSAIERYKRDKEEKFAVLFLDLDRFKIVNDSLGHLLGDELLVQVSQRLFQCLRSVDMIARLGGDEFAILLDDIEEDDDAILVAERLQEALAEPYRLSDHEVYTTASIGIAFSSQGYQKAEDFLRDSDSAMYQAKSEGKAQYAIFDRKLHDDAVRRLELENDLRRALDNEEFQLYYQPIVNVDDQRPVGFEALVRWQHPQKGIVSPIDFIPVAEETGLIIPIGWELIRQACVQAKAWLGAYGHDAGLAVSVNISSRQLMLPEFADQLHAILEGTGAPPSWIKLEMTETAIIENPTFVATVLEAVRALEVELCIDDFGTGYSSLSYLHQLPFDIVKIDRAFVQDICAETESLEIVQAIASLCKNLGVKTTAEGVEEQEQLDMLGVIKCDYAQGYYFAKPMPADDVPDYLDSVGVRAMSSESTT